LTFGAWFWPELPVALRGPTGLTSAPKFSGPRPIVPGALPAPLFQWYVVIELRQ